MREAGLTGMTQGHLTACGRCGMIGEEAPKQEEEASRWDFPKQN